MLLQIITGPLDLTVIENAQRNLRNVIHHQGILRQSLEVTKTTLKHMLASFIDELGRLSTATGDYHDSIENLAQQIRQTDDVQQLNVLLEEVMRETRSVQASALRSREEVLRAREQVSVAELKIRDLESQLEDISSQALRDHLTGTLNRRGLAESLTREMSAAERNSQPLSVALLDIDNFKDLNDTFGHQAGDDALVHLSNVIKETMRPSDCVARYGGEEFLILLPNTDSGQGCAVILRLQRELTKRFFLHDNRKLLITFSAGISTCREGDTQASVIDRADRALYTAKRAGKNRVTAA
jgi:diguanylate cyclase